MPTASVGMAPITIFSLFQRAARITVSLYKVLASGEKGEGEYDEIRMTNDKSMMKLE
jgi:hypothetical protein